eukprot:gene44753-3170_t
MEQSLQVVLYARGETGEVDGAPDSLLWRNTSALRYPQAAIARAAAMGIADLRSPTHLPHRYEGGGTSPTDTKGVVQGTSPTDTKGVVQGTSPTDAKGVVQGTSPTDTKGVVQGTSPTDTKGV